VFWEDFDLWEVDRLPYCEFKIVSSKLNPFDDALLVLLLLGGFESASLKMSFKKKFD
jgi:hypothetical protein